MKNLGFIISMVGVLIMFGSTFFFNGITYQEKIIDVAYYFFGIGIWVSGFFVDELKLGGKRNG